MHFTRTAFGSERFRLLGDALVLKELHILEFEIVPRRLLQQSVLVSDDFYGGGS
jgi:hypothetical protein